MWAEDMDETTLILLARAYCRRKQWESGVQTGPVMGRSAPPPAPTAGRKSSADQLLTTMGARME